ncbi:MAG: HTTM domain-containing protein [Planctomycetaceae bacterium]|nr:HTTM domain-containing protein [Planctomycetaceae bacterium]
MAELIALDLRALATFRIGLACVVLADLWNRATALEADYTDFGVLPRELATQFAGPYSSWSLYMLRGDVAWPTTLFIVTALAAVLLAVGWYTRLATIVVWLLLISLHFRNDLLLDGGDAVLSGCLFWGMFLPLGADWSFDARRRDSQAGTPSVASVATIALVMLIFLVYFSSGFMKRGESWENGTALFYALNLEVYVSPLGRQLLQFPRILPWLTYTVLYAERYGIWLLWLPWFHVPLRTTLVMLGWLFHLSLILLLDLGVFPFVCLVAWIPLLPTPVWDALTGRWSKLFNKSNTRQGPASSVAPIPSPWRRRLGWLGQAALLFVLYGVVMANLTATFPNRFGNTRLIPTGLMNTIDALRLQQGWALYAPDPGERDGWFVATGTLANGTLVDLWNPDQPPTDDKPNLNTYFKHQRWKRLGFLAVDSKYLPLRRALLEWLVRQWNRDVAKSPQEHVVRAELRYWIETTKADRTVPWIEIKLAEIDETEP